ncbi:MAG: primosomal protein N' [Tenericutes bacterium]|nr:primosomal protein N' [Mycoplasmatota bacterium]
MIAKILVDIKAKNVDKTYDYSIPLEYSDILEIGARVIVPFGKRFTMGFCLEIAESSDYKKELKPIERIIDMESYLTEELIELARSIQVETSALLIKILETMLPAALKVVYKPKIQVINKEDIDESIQSVFEYTDQVLLESVAKEFYPQIQKEIKKHNIKQIYDIKSKNKSLSYKFAKLTNKPIDKISEKQMSVVNYLKKKKNLEANVSNTQKSLCITSSVINTLEKHGYVKTYYKEQYREVSSLYKSVDKDVVLNEDQEVAYKRIMEELGNEFIFLLHGVTGSGKTEIYLKVIEKVIEKNQSVIYLVPEIALTPMMMSRFRNRFGKLVAMLHSGLSTLEKYDEWRRVVAKEARIIIGARSACFAPVDDLGLVVIDECHESTYKQDNTPNYYAVEVLKKRIKYHNAVMILGSATPNIDSYARQIRGYYELLDLPKRAINSTLPQVEVVDMKKEFISGNSSTFSLKLQEEIKERLEKKEQVILLLNRRGHSNFIICRNCGHVFQCPDCDISLTYHEYSHSLKCHYCGHDEKIPKKCVKCESEDLRYMGSGTQKVEGELGLLFPNAKIVRMDNDTTRKKNAHERLLHEFENNGDILLGTQMIAKGLDFPRVTLVGIIQADNNLYISNFRAPEKTFQLLMQVSGRAGRRGILGKVVIQAFNPDHYAIKYACNNDYLGFYHHEMRIRKLAKYSPFYYMVELKIMGPSMRDSFYNGIEIVKHLKRNLNNKPIVLGPAIPEVRRIKTKYICEIIIKYRDLGNLNEVLNDVLDKYQMNENYIRIDRFPNVG